MLLSFYHINCQFNLYSTIQNSAVNLSDCVSNAAL